MRNYIIIIAIILSISDSSIAQFNLDYEMFDTLKINNKISIYRIEADTINIDKEYGHKIISKIKIFDDSKDKLIQEIKDTSDLGFSGGEIYLEDINLDKYEDLVLDLGAYNLNSTYYVWLYNKTKNNFSDYIVFNSNERLIPDSIFTTTIQELGGRGSSTNLYKIVNGDFILIEMQNLSNDGYLGEYENKFYENNKLKALINGFYLNDYDGNNSVPSNDTVTVEIYQEIFDTLVVDKKFWLIYIYKDSYLIRDDIYNCVLTEKHCTSFKKEKYNYTKVNSKMLVDTTTYKLVNNNWVNLK